MWESPPGGRRHWMASNGNPWLPPAATGRNDITTLSPIEAQKNATSRTSLTSLVILWFNHCRCCKALQCMTQAKKYSYGENEKKKEIVVCPFHTNCHLVKVWIRFGTLKILGLNPLSAAAAKCVCSIYKSLLLTHLLKSPVNWAEIDWKLAGRGGESKRVVVVAGNNARVPQFLPHGNSELLSTPRDFPNRKDGK